MDAPESSVRPIGRLRNGVIRVNRPHLAEEIPGPPGVGQKVSISGLRKTR